MPQQSRRPVVRLQPFLEVSVFLNYFIVDSGIAWIVVFMIHAHIKVPAQIVVVLVRRSGDTIRAGSHAGWSHVDPETVSLGASAAEIIPTHALFIIATRLVG